MTAAPGHLVYLWTSDRTALRQAFGPYDSAEEAARVRSRLEQWPALTGYWATDVIHPTSGSPGEDLRNGWTREMAAEVRARFAANEACQHCKGLHARACPRVKTMSFHPNGGLASVEFWPDGQWSDAQVIWPEDVPDFDKEK